MNNLNLYSETVSGYTAVSDLFIDEYVPSANGDFVKVYLYLLRLLTRKNSSLSISSLADTFNQTENDVMRALRYWDKSGLVCLSYDDNNQLCGITVKDLKNNSSPEPDRSRYATPEFNNDTADTTVPATAFADETSADEAASDVSSNVVSMDFAIKAPSHTVEPSKVTAPAEKLDELIREFDIVESRRGLGLMQGLVLKDDARPYVKELLTEGVIVVTAGTNVIRMLPPFVITEEHVDEFIGKLKNILKKSK